MKQTLVIACLALLLALASIGRAQSTIHTQTLHQAAIAGNLAEVRLYLDEGVSVNAKDENGWTPLTHASMNSNAMETVMFLIHNGADVNASSNEWMPLLSAAAIGNPEIAKVLISKGANVNAQIRNGLTPLRVAAHRGDVEMVNLLIAKGADVNKANPLVAVADKSGNKYPEVVKALLHSGANVEGGNKDGRTPLMQAAWGCGNPQIVNALLDKGANVNAKNDKGETPLKLAIARGHKEIADLLRQHGAKE